jgi:hypothetical protein
VRSQLTINMEFPFSILRDTPTNNKRFATAKFEPVLIPNGFHRASTDESCLRCHETPGNDVLPTKFSDTSPHPRYLCHCKRLCLVLHLSSWRRHGVPGAVGISVARSPARIPRAELPHEALILSVEANFGVRTKDARAWDPSILQLARLRPIRVVSLTATDQDQCGSADVLGARTDGLLEFQLWKRRPGNLVRFH